MIYTLERAVAFSAAKGAGGSEGTPETVVEGVIISINKITSFYFKLLRLTSTFPFITNYTKQIIR